MSYVSGANRSTRNHAVASSVHFSTASPAVGPLQAKIDTSPRQVMQQKRVDDVQKAIIQRKGPNGLPDNLKAGIESLSGMSMDDVQVHYNSSKPAQVQALAYAQGNNIYLAPGQAHHLPHEAWHVVQQRQGRVKPTIEVNGMAVNDNIQLEREAGVMGAQANGI